MTRFSTRMKALAAAGLAGLTGLALAGAAQAGVSAYPDGVPLRGGERCAVHLYQSNSSGLLMAKVDGREAGRYELWAYQGLPTSDIDVDLDGRFGRSGGGDTVLVRTHLNMGYVVPGGFRGFDELRDAEYGQDAALHVQLDVFDRSGRLICRTRNVDLYPMEVLRGRPRPARSSHRYSVPVPERVRAAPRAYASQPARALPPPEMRHRLRRAVISRNDD